MSGNNKAINIGDETLLRYIHEKSKLRGDGTVHFGALLPIFDKQYQRLETSTYRHACFSDVWEAGMRYCDEELRPVKAVAMFTGQNVYDSELDIDPDDDPPGHASIIGWPEDIENEDRKEQRKQLAVRLARLTRFERRDIAS